MKKLVILLVLLTFVNVNAQDLVKKVNFTAIGSENYFKRSDSSSISSSLSTSDKKIKLSIYQMVQMETDSSVVVNKLQKVKLVGCYQIAEKLIIIPPDWDGNNINAFGVRLCFQIR